MRSSYLVLASIAFAITFLSCNVKAENSNVNINFASMLSGVSSSASSCPSLNLSAIQLPLPKWLSFLVPLLNITGNCFGQSQDQCNQISGCYFYFGVCLEANTVSYLPKGPITLPSFKKRQLPSTTAAPTASNSVTLRNETTVQCAIALNASKGKEIGAVYQAYLSPQQEGGEEEDTPSSTPSQFKSSKPSTPRNQRKSRGHGALQFTKDLSKAYAYLTLDNINPSEINMLHIHCGRPGQLGPIIVDFSTIGNFTKALQNDGVMAFDIYNEDIVAVASAGQGEGPLGLLTAGCPIVQNIPTDKAKTVAGMELIARAGELYFNVHTYAQTYYGDVRGQLVQVTAGN